MALASEAQAKNQNQIPETKWESRKCIIAKGGKGNSFKQTLQDSCVQEWHDKRNGCSRAIIYKIFANFDFKDHLNTEHVMRSELFKQNFKYQR